MNDRKEMGMMNKTWEHLITKEYKRIGIVGMAKNSGKTVTLNALMAWLSRHHKRVAVMSIGRDGEAEDVLTRTQKPKISLKSEMLFATGKKLLEQTTLSCDILEETAIETYFGSIVIAKVKEPGDIELTGANNNTEHKWLMEKLLAYGADKVLIDGAMDRQTIASPELIDGYIMATGAVLSRTMDKTVAFTKQRIAQLNLPLVADNWQRLFLDACEQSAVSLVEGDEQGDIKKIIGLKAFPTGLHMSPMIFEAFTAKTEGILFSGALSENMVRYIFQNWHQDKPPTFYVKEGTNLFIPYEAWLTFASWGITFKACKRASLIAVTINPTAPQGYCYDPATFKSTLQKALGGVVVINVLENKEETFA
jgi:hypothetical protein